MKRKSAPNPDQKSAARSIQRLHWQDLPGCEVEITSVAFSADHAVVFLGDREQLSLLLFRESMRNVVNITVERGVVPTDPVLLAMGRTIMAHFAAVPEWRNIP